MRNNFDKEFEEKRNFIKTMFKVITGIVVVAFVIQITAGVYLGTKVVEEVDQNGGVAKTMGKFYKEFKEAAE